MYDRNRGVQSIIDAVERGDPDEALPLGGMFNVKTGRITHSEQCHVYDGGHWYYITADDYPVYENGLYVGYYNSGYFERVV